MRCHPCYTAGCEECQERRRLADRAARRAAGAAPTNGECRSPSEQRRAEALVARLKLLSPYELARYCEIVLSIHMDGIDVRPERRARPRAA